MDLREALTQITEIRLQMARTEVFRGYRAVPAAFSGLVALLASAVQSLTVQDPVQQINAYLGIWIGAALISGMSAVLEMGMRARNATSPLTRELTFLAMEQFCPCLVAGALVTMVVVHSAPESVWILPGLWQVLYSLGIFASGRLLPRSMFGAAVFYLMTGLGTLALMQGPALSTPGRWAFPSAWGNCLPPRCFTRPWSGTMMPPKPRPEEPTGRFAYEGLERIFHEKARLGIMTSLVTNPRGVIFSDLKELCHLTDGNLSRHLQVLNEAGFVEIWKGFHKNRPQTLCRITDEGRRRFLEYINVLETVVEDALKAASKTTSTSNLAEGWSPV